MPCLWIIGHNLSKPAYKIMFSIGLLDVFMLTGVTGVYGVFAIRGDVFCSHPTLTYTIGCFDLAIWVSSTELTVLLALYRCIQMWRPDLAALLFTGHRTSAWIFISLCHMTFVLFFTTPILWNSIYVTMPFNPHAGYFDDGGQKYHNLHHNIHNLCILFGLIGLYILFAIIVVSKRRHMRSTSSIMPKAQRESFLQAILISACSGVTDAVWEVIPLMPSLSESVILVGLPGLIYLTINKTIRRSVLSFFVHPSNTQSVTPIRAVS
ncbi:Protein SRT-41 [Aphelenchoides avenae]|nr:Protein SRT-41 [Aphelenchus avenae]